MCKIYPVLLLVFASGLFADTLPPTYNRVHLQASAGQDVENDVKVAELYTKHQDKNSLKVSDKVNRDIKWAVGLAKADGIRVKTLNYHTRPLYERKKNSYNYNKIIGWSAEQAIKLESQDSDLLGALIGKLQARLKMRTLNYKVSKLRKNKVKDELIDKAISKFVARAKKIVKGFAMNSYKLVKININTGAFSPPPRMYTGAKGAMMAADVAEAVVESGTSEINITVSGEIELGR